MLAIDTNIVVRFLTRDDERQAQRTRALIDSSPVFVPTTVLLEAEWVLRSVYQLGAAEIASALTQFIGHPNVKPEQPDRVAAALEWAGRGMDFADALHLASARECEAFVTFDERLTKLAKRVANFDVRAP